MMGPTAYSTPNPVPQGGELFWAQFSGAKVPKNCAIIRTRRSTAWKGSALSAENAENAENEERQTPE